MPRFIVGIDLGTTNTVVAWSEPAGSGGDGGGAISLLPMPQLIAPGEVAERALLPSQRYQAAPGEIADADVALPWSANLPERVLVGQIARRLGAQVPGRAVGSAKSWLSHGAVDRLAPILPWGADETVAKVSPVAASASYLAHVRAAWNHAHPGDPLERQDVVLTVPASFDDAARELTLEAAREAGLPTLRLLEEPQAALYDWLFRHRDELATALADSRLVLVCDVGGGTTDLSLIQVALDDGVPTLTRIGVGQHLMLGGDNMDLALAHLVESRLGGGGSRLSAGRLAQLVERCRAAKEQLLAADAPEQVTVTLLGGGGRLVGASRSAVLTRDEVRRHIVDGFFPATGLQEPLKRARAGLVEFGLPYASDPAVTRHVANFLRQHAEASRAATGALAIPDTLLLNGGVFRADALSRRVRDTLADWRGAPLVDLHNDNPDVAVARGAVAYALALRGRAPRIGGGSPRSYFLVLDAARQQGVCVLPQGAEPLDEQVLAGRTFALRVGQPVRFHLLSSSVERSGQAPARAGELVALDSLELTPLPPVATVVKALRDDRRKEIPVQLVTSLSELGTLAMDCVSVDDASQRWRLEFQLRAQGDAASAEAAAAAKAASRLDEAAAQIELVFGARSTRPDAKDVKQLRATLERLLGARERWGLDMLRTLFDALWQRAKARRRSAEHERVWLNLAGYCLRPGFGDALDDWRVEQLWTLFEQGLAHPRDAQVCAEWWTLWRRVAGGLPDAAQQRLLDDFAQNLEALEGGARQPPGVVKAGADDMVRLGASLERIPAPHKVEIGDWLLGKLASAEASPGQVAPLLWALGRLGAREPFHASAHAVVPPADAGRWLETLLALDWKKSEGAAFAAAHLARQSGDRTRDVSEALREKVVARLLSSQAAPSWVAMVRDGGRLDEAESRQVFGEALPPGLKLIS